MIKLKIRDCFVFSINDWKKKAKAKTFIEYKKKNKNRTIKGILVNRNRKIIEIIIVLANDIIIY